MGEMGQEDWRPVLKEEGCPTRVGEGGRDQSMRDLLDKTRAFGCHPEKVGSHQRVESGAFM